MSINRQIFYLAAALGLCGALSSAEDLDAGGDVLQIPADEDPVILRQFPMPDPGEGRMARMLSRYYAEGLGGAENWEQISSLKVMGTLKLKSGEFDLNAFQRKPNLIKMTVRANQRELVLAYDGETAWQKLPGRDIQAEPMSAEEARKFINNASFGSHLLYPFSEGKKIQFIDTVPAEGSICHQIRVTLDTEYQIDYFIDIRSYLEVKVVNTDLRDQSTITILYKDYVWESGMPIARQVESFENGEWSSSLQINDVKVNAGVVPWMFEMRH